MRIFFDNVDFRSNTGPNVFARRLANKFVDLGHQVVPYEEEHDVHLAFIFYTKEPKVQKSILRIDGIWFKPESFAINNKPLFIAYSNSYKVICQSHFDKEMLYKHFGRREVFVIHNGIKMSETSDNKKDIFVCSANWHRQKRLEENIKLFNKIKNENSELLVFGNNSNINSLSSEDMKNVKLMGSRSPDECLSYFKLARYMIHLAWLDHCPNTVVEALSVGTPVICSDSGGTKEIVRNNGIIIPEDVEYKYELTDYDSPYPLSLDNVKLPEQDILVNANYLDIESVAKEYIEEMK